MYLKNEIFDIKNYCWYPKQSIFVSDKNFLSGRIPIYQSSNSYFDIRKSNKQVNKYMYTHIDEKVKITISDPSNKSQ